MASKRPPACQICHCPAPAHDFGCWELLQPERPAVYATTAALVAFGEVLQAVNMTAHTLRRIARGCTDPHVKRQLQAYVRGLDALPQHQTPVEPA